MDLRFTQKFIKLPLSDEIVSITNVPDRIKIIKSSQRVRQSVTQFYDRN